jgi:hypothetical protein
MRPYLEKNQHKKRAGGVAEVVGCLLSRYEAPEFKPQYHQRLGGG